MKRIVILCFVLIIKVVTCIAQQLTANAPQQVAIGQQFRLTYTVNSHDVSSFRIGQIPSDAFEVLMGPSTSRQSSFSMVNGKTSQTSTITYTYILSATKNGTFTIPAATINVEGNTISSNTLKITVSGTAQSGSGGSAGARQQQQETRPAGSAISGSDLFIKVSASKRKVVEQEPILLTYKVYTLVSLTQLNGNMPDLKGFHTQEIPLPQQKSFSVEQLNGRSYKTVTWSQYVMFPQITGKLTIPSITFDGVVVQQNRNIDPFEAFFNGGSGYVEVKKQIKAPSVEIEVEPLPQRPTGFSGGVGRFTVKAEIDKTEVKANDPVTVKVTVSGTGNLKLVKQPEVKFPKDFDTYDAKVTDKTRLTTSGLEGSMVYEMLAVPRHQGKYDIPPVEFVYYDTQAKQYKTITTDGFQLTVEKGDVGSSVVHDFTQQEDVQLLANDIRHIKLGKARIDEADSLFYGSKWYVAILTFMLLAFVSLFLVFRRRAIENADLVKARGKRANKVATRRLRKAAKLMNDNKPDLFYDEALRALWGYVGDKLNIPVEQLSHDNITERLQERNVDNEVISQFIEAIDECEFERYAPGDPKGNMNKVYDKAMTAIEKIENNVKRGTRKAGLALVLALTMMPIYASADGKSQADSAYTAGAYQDAIAQYETLLGAGGSADIYYNLGNAYYRIDDMTHAVLAYERALRLSPGDDDIRFNLQLARSKTVDKIVPETETLIATWYKSLVNVTSADGWGYMSIISLALAIVLALLYLFSNTMLLRKTGFFGGVVMLLLFVITCVFAWQQKQRLADRSEAVVMSSAVPVKSTPMQNGTDLFILHGGTKVQVTDDSMTDWKKIRVADGKQGWIEASQIELI